MTITTLRRRLDRIEADRSPAAPTAILTDGPIGDVAADMRAADALANWRSWVARGRATLSNGVLCIAGPEMTVDEWAAAHVTAH